MKDIIRKILEEKEPPKSAKGRLIASANLYLLFKDTRELFGSNLPSATLDVTDTITTNFKTKENENGK
jgi:hypothetical protein